MHTSHFYTLCRRYIRDFVLLAVLLGTALVLSQWIYQSVRVADMSIDAPPVFLPLEQFHEVERFPDQNGIYRWTRARSTVPMPNPGGSAVIRMRLAGGAGRSVPITLQATSTPLAFTVTPELRQYAILQPMPATERVELVIELPAFEERNRTLGMVVSHLRISGGGAAPGYVVLALLLATASGYALLRQAGNSLPLAAGLVVVVQGMVLLWQAAGGWQYALFVPLLLLVTVASIGAVIGERWLVPRRQTEQTDTQEAATPQPIHTLPFLLPAVLLLALMVRLPWLAAPDPVGDMELAARRMWFLDMHGLAGAYTGGGDYMPFRLYLLHFLSQFVLPLGGDFHEPLPAVTKLLIKLPGLLADQATIAMIYTWSLRWLLPQRAAALAALYACAPPVWINVAWWGQVDTLLMLPLVGMVTLLDQAEGRWSWLCWTVALLIKPQAIVLAPLLYVATVRLHGSRGVAQGGALAIGCFALACVPLSLAGQGPGLMQAYLGSVGRFPMLTAGAYNLWYLVTLGEGGHDVGQGIGGVSFHQIGLLLVGSVALLVGMVLLRRADRPVRAEAAAVLALAFFALPTQIHERYLFLPLAFLALRIPTSEYLVWPFVALAFSATLNIFGDLDGFIRFVTPWIATSPIPLTLAVVNLGILVFLTGHLLRSV